jgi:hypothetical protein
MHRHKSLPLRLLTTDVAGEPMANFSLPAGWMRLRKGTYKVTTGEGSRVVECLLWVGVSPQGLERVKYFADRNSFGERFADSSTAGHRR